MRTLAIIGLGAVVRNIHIPAYARLRDKVKVTAGCDPSEASRDHARAKWGLRVFEMPLEMLEHARPDIVAVCTPPRMHREHVLLALSHGCHVFCEKPLANSLSDGQEMADASEKAGRLVVVNNQFPCMNIHSAAKKSIGSAEFGRLFYLHVWHTMHTDEVTEAGWRGELSRRLCFEFGVHVFELVRFFFDADPVRILAHMPQPGGRTRCDVVNVIAMEFADGRAASIVLDRMSQGPDGYLDMRLDGEHAVIHTSIGGQVEFGAGIHTRDRRPFMRFRFVKGGKAELLKGTRSKIIATDGLNIFADSTARHFGSFLEAIQDGTLPPGNIRDNLKTLALVMAAYDSAESGKWIGMHPYMASATGAP